MTSVPRFGLGDGLDVELAGAFAAPAHAPGGRQAGAAGLDRDAVGDDEAGIKPTPNWLISWASFFWSPSSLAMNSRVPLLAMVPRWRWPPRRSCRCRCRDGQGLGFLVEADAHSRFGWSSYSAALSSASKRSLSQASEALETSSRRKISLLEYSEWVTRCRICLTSAWKAWVCLVLWRVCRRNLKANAAQVGPRTGVSRARDQDLRALTASLSTSSTASESSQPRQASVMPPAVGQLGRVVLPG